MTASFVHSLPLAHDPRLASLRPARSGVPHAPDRTGLRGVDEAAASPAVGEKLRAAVDAGSIVSFVSGLSAEETSDVLYSTQLAQRAASARFDRFAATKDWYGAYLDVLDRLGWVGEALAFTERKTAAGKFSMDRSALDVIAAVATGAQLAILVKTLDALKKLGESDRPLKIFDLQAMQELSGNFQVGAAQKGGNGAVSVALGAFYFHASDNRGKFLFWSWGAEKVQFWTAVRKMTLNADLYAVHRSAVAAKLKVDASDYIEAVPIK
jgi:hypothetical protein